MPNKVRFPLYMSHNTAERLDLCYTLDDSRNKSNYIENAINFYTDYLSVEDNNRFLPKAISSAIDGQLGVSIDRVSKLLYPEFKKTKQLNPLRHNGLSCYSMI